MVYILITSKNRKEYTDRCLESIYNQTFKDFEVYIVDDGSTDDAVEYISKKYPKVHIITGSGDLWWTGAMNVLLDTVRPLLKEDDYVLTQNQDAYMNPNFIEDLISQSKKYDNAIIGSTVRSYNSKKIIANAHKLKKFVFRPVVVEEEGDVNKTDTCAGRGTLIPKVVIDDLKSFSSKLPHYGADYEFFLRANKKGYRTYVSNTAISYTLDDNKGLAYVIKHKERKSLKDFFDLLFHRRSANNMFANVPIILMYVPWLYKVPALVMYFGYFAKFLLIDVPFSNLKYLFRKNG